MLVRHQRLMVMLDSLVDTRLGLVKQHYSDNITDAKLELYHNRDHVRVWDIFGIPEDDYKAKYAKRDLDTLRCSFGTLMSEMLRSLISQGLLKSELNANINPVEVSINVWPYETDDDFNEVLVEAIRERVIYSDKDVANKVKFKVASLDIGTMSAKDIRADYETLIIYDLADWLSTSNELTANAPAPTLVVYYAALLTEDSDEMRELASKDTNNPFKLTRQALAPFFLAEGLDCPLYNIAKT